MLNKAKPFRMLDKKLPIEEFKKEPLSYIIKYQAKHRKTFIVEIRRDWLNLYFLGHAIDVKGTASTGYYLMASKEFDPSKRSPDKWENMVKKKGGKWQIFLKHIKSYEQFNELMDDILTQMILYRKGDISEGVSELNHFVDNRDVSLNKKGILIIDKQVVYPGISGRIDLLGLKRLKDDLFTFAIIELKNKNNKDIKKVFGQTQGYIDIIWDNYAHFKLTYEKVLEQKKTLHLIKKAPYQIAPQSMISKADIQGVVVLDNYNIRSDLKKGGKLSMSIENWRSIDKLHSIKLFLKTNIFDEIFFLDCNAASVILESFKK